MNSRLLVPAAALAVLVGGAAGAQNSGTTAPNPQFPPQAGTMNIPAPMNPGFNPALGFADPNANFGFPNGFNPAFNNGFNPAFNNGFNPAFNNGFNPAFNNGFNPAFPNGFNPAFNGGSFDPALAAALANGGFNNNGFNGFNGFNNGFTGFGTGYFPTFAGNPYMNPYAFGGYPAPGVYGGYPNASPDMYNFGGNLATAANTAARRSPVVPVLGLNTPAPPPAGRVYDDGKTRVDLTPKTPEDFAARRLIPDQDSVASNKGAADQTQVAAGTVIRPNAAENRPAAGAEVRRAPATPEQVRLAARAQELMANRPMREGLIVSLNGDTVDVSYECQGKTQTDSFPAGEVFFFRTSGALATAATAKGSLHIGDHVLVACDAEQPRQAVAGSRQEMRSSDTMKGGSTQHQHGQGSGTRTRSRY